MRETNEDAEILGTMPIDEARRAILGRAHNLVLIAEATRAGVHGKALVVKGVDRRRQISLQGSARQKGITLHTRRLTEGRMALWVETQDNGAGQG